MSDEMDRIVTVTADLSDDLRGWLRARHEPPPALASALAYELAALIARHAPDRRAASNLVDTWAQTMKEQIAELGVGGEHP